MALEDYTKAHKPAAPEKSTAQLANLVGLMLISALVGFFGGLVALRVSPDIISSSGSITETVVTQQGELIADIVDEVAMSVVSINVTSVEETLMTALPTTKLRS